MAGQRLRRRLRAAITSARPLPPLPPQRSLRGGAAPARLGPTLPPPPLRGSGRRVSSMLGSPGRLIDLDQEYSAGASARTAAGGTPQVPLAPRLASRVRPPSRSPRPEGPPRGRSPRPEGPPASPAPRPPPPGSASSASGVPGSPLRGSRLRGAAGADELCSLEVFLEERAAAALYFLQKPFLKIIPLPWMRSLSNFPL